MLSGWSMIGNCTHLGCIPLGQKPTDNKGAVWRLVLPVPWFGAYDTSGRIRQGPAPTQPADILPYAFVFRYQDPDRLINSRRSNDRAIISLSRSAS
jgi:hypothetical protein